MIDQELLSILADPETKQELELAAPELLEKINRQIQEGTAQNRAGQPVSSQIEGGLVPKQNPKFLYPVREGIPVMLIDESIPLT